MRSVLTGILLVCGLAMIRCSEPTKSENTPPAPPAMKVIAAPASANAPAEIRQKANEINNYFAFISATLDDVAGVTPSVNGNIYTWEVTMDSGTMLMKVKAVRRSDQSVDWTVIIDGQADDSTLYVNRTLFIGKAGAGNRSQSWTFYDVFSGGITHKIVWEIDKNNTLTVRLALEAIKALWEIINRVDFSGSYRFEQDAIERYTAQWSSNGAGGFMDHASTPPQSGSWE